MTELLVFSLHIEFSHDDARDVYQRGIMFTPAAISFLISES